MTKKILHWLNKAICQISVAEIVAVCLNIVAFMICGSFVQSSYLWAIIIVCDLMVICAHGAQLEAKHANGATAPWRAPTPLLIRLIAFMVLFILAAERKQDIIMSTYVWYVVVITAVCHAFYSILLAMHATNPSWLEGTQGKIGIPNWISIIRMALSALVPHLYSVQPLGSISNLIATILLIVAMSTDAVDGFFARKLNQTTKAGKALDPLGDKVIFYPTAIAFIIATHGTLLQPVGILRLIFYSCLIIMFIRDALVFLWFFFGFTKLQQGIAASWVDKIRMIAMCIWLGASALALTFTELQPRLSLASFISIVAVATLSIASIAVDYIRVKPLLQAMKNNND